jgi:hypothetical protein
MTLLERLKSYHQGHCSLVRRLELDGLLRGCAKPKTE